MRVFFSANFSWALVVDKLLYAVVKSNSRLSTSISFLMLMAFVIRGQTIFFGVHSGVFNEQVNEVKFKNFTASNSDFD